jgi:hypothetical protein
VALHEPDPFVAKEERGARGGTNPRRCNGGNPERFDPSLQQAIAAFDGTPTSKRLRQGVARGLDPDAIGELTLRGIEANWPYIVSDTEWEPAIEATFAAVRVGSDRFRKGKDRG